MLAHSSLYRRRLAATKATGRRIASEGRAAGHHPTAYATWNKKRAGFAPASRVAADGQHHAYAWAGAEDQILENDGRQAYAAAHRRKVTDSFLRDAMEAFPKLVLVGLRKR
jgi:hypothetical protein